MIAAAGRLSRRVLTTQAVFSAATALVVALLAPRLVLLEDELAWLSAPALMIAIAAAGAVSFARTWLLLRRHRWVLRALSLGSGSVEPPELARLSDEPPRITFGWVVPNLIALGLLTTAWRPEQLDLTTGATLSLLGAVMTAAASLPLHVVVRTAFLGALELAPSEAMREVVESAERMRRHRGRVSRRLLAAVATPVAFVAFGSALIANAHLRRADERNREETARVVARSALEAGPGLVAGAGLDEALDEARDLGFSATIAAYAAGYQVEHDRDGIVELIAPLDQGAARVRFSGSTVGTLSTESLLIASAALTLAALLGVLLGRVLAQDLRVATRGVRLLGTEAVLGGGTRILYPVRLVPVAELGRAIERLAERFRVFARAQERAIEAREAATRMRGLFFASVSHDLKGPLNAILGLSELIRQRELLTPGQTESLDFIERRGRELLALIETILDAARVEAGQLLLLRDSERVESLVEEAADKGRDLGGDVPAIVRTRIGEQVPELFVDRLRVARALATLIGHSLRTAEQPEVWVVANAEGGSRVRIDVEVPSGRFSALDLGRMLEPPRQPGAGEHRGLSLGLRLARSVIELHGGSIDIEDRGSAGVSFAVRLPVDRRLIRGPSLRSSPRTSAPPPAGSSAPASARASAPASSRPARRLVLRRKR